MSEELQEIVVSDWSNYNPGDHQSIKKIIKDNINSVFANYVAIGFYLNNINDRKLYLEDGYSGIGDYAASEYGIDEDKCSYLRKIAKRFCIENSPALLPEYRGFKIQKLREMTSLTDEQLEQVTIATTRAEIRGIKKPKTEKVAPAQVELAQPKCDIRDQIISSGEKGLTCSGFKLEQCNGCDKYDPSVTPKLELIDDLDFTVRTYNCLKRAGVDTIEQLCSMTEDEVVRVRNFSLKCMTEVKEKLGELGLSLKAEDQPDIEEQFLKCLHDPEFPCNIENVVRVAATLDDVNCNGICCWNCKEVCGAKCNSAIGHQHKIQSANDEPEVVDNEPEIVNDVDEPERDCRIHRPDLRGMMQDPYCKVCGSFLEYKQDCKCGNNIDWSGLELVFEYEEEQLRLKAEQEQAEITEIEVVETEIIEAEIIQTVTEETKLDYTPQFFLDEQKNKLNEIIGAEGIPDIILQRQKTIVCALASMVCDLDNSEPAPKQAQPELPILKNNDQRKEFIEAFETWPLWIDTKDTEEKYYRYNFDNGSFMVIKVYFQKGYSWGELKNKDHWGSNEYYLIKSPELHFKDCQTNMTALLDYLKDIQKK